MNVIFIVLLLQCPHRFAVFFAFLAIERTKDGPPGVRR